MDLSSISNTHTATSHRLHPFHRLRSLSPRALGINTTVSRNPKSSATSFPILTCSGRKQVYSALHLQRALLFLNYYQKKKCIRVFSHAIIELTVQRQSQVDVIFSVREFTV